MTNYNNFSLESNFNNDVTFYKNVNIGGNLTVQGSSLFKGPTKFEKDVDIDELLVRTRFDVGIDNGVKGTAFNVDKRTEKVGIFTATPQQKLQFNSEEDNTFVITGLGTVGIGTVNPGVGVSSLNDSAQGKLSLDLETLSVRRNIYDSVGYHGANGGYLQRDEYGIRWTEVTPSFTEGIYVQDEGVYIPLWIVTGKQSHKCFF